MSHTSSEKEDPTSSSAGKALSEDEVSQSLWDNFLQALREDNVKFIKNAIKSNPDLLLIRTDKDMYLPEICLIHYPDAKRCLNYILRSALSNENTPDDMLWDLWVWALAKDRSEIVKKIIVKKKHYVTYIEKADGQADEAEEAEEDKEERTNIDICINMGAVKTLEIILKVIDPRFINRISNKNNTPISRVVKNFKEGIFDEAKAVQLAKLLFAHGAFVQEGFNWREELKEDTELYRAFAAGEMVLQEKFEEALVLEDIQELERLLDINEKLNDQLYGEEKKYIEVFCITKNKYIAFKWILENYLFEDINYHDYRDGGAHTSPPMIFQPWALFNEGKCTEEVAVLFAQLMINNGADVSLRIVLEDGNESSWRDFVDETNTPKSLYKLYEKFDKGNPGSEICKQFLRDLLSEKPLDYTQIKNALIENEALINARDESGRNVLHIAITRQDLKLFNLFLTHQFKNMTKEVFELRKERDEERDYYKFHFDARDKEGRTPLFLAIELAANEKNAAPFVCELLKKGADPELSTNDGVGPLHKAAAKGYNHIVKALIASVIIGFSQREIRDVYGAIQKIIQLNVAKATLTDNLGMNLVHYALTHGKTEIFDAFRTGNRGSYDFDLVELCFHEDHEGHRPFQVGLHQKDLGVRKKINDFIFSIHETLNQAIGDLMSSPRLKKSGDSDRDASETSVSVSEEDKQIDSELVKKNPKRKLQNALTALAKSMETYPDPKNEFQRQRNEKAVLVYLAELALITELQNFSFDQSLSSHDSVDSMQSVMKTIDDQSQRERVNQLREIISNFLRYTKIICTDLEAQKRIKKVAYCAAYLVTGLRKEAWVNAIIGYSDDDSGEEVAEEHDKLEPKLCGAIREMQDEKAVLEYLLELPDEEKRRGYEHKDSPLHLAADKGYAKVISYLVDFMQSPAEDLEDQQGMLQYYAKNSLGMNFLHNAFQNGHTQVVNEFSVDELYFDRFFSFLVRQKDDEGDTPIYVGMTSKHPDAREKTKQFVEQVYINVEKSVHDLENELAYWNQKESVLILKATLKKMLKRVRKFENPKFELLKQHNVDMVLLNLTILDLIRNMKELKRLKDPNDFAKESSVVIQGFIQDAKAATVDDYLLDIILNVALVAGAIVAGVAVGVLIGALIAYLSGVTAVVLFGLSAFELAGGCVLGVLSPVATGIVSQLVLFGFRRDIKDITSIVNAMENQVEFEDTSENVNII